MAKPERPPSRTLTEPAWSLPAGFPWCADGQVILSVAIEITSRQRCAERAIGSGEVADVGGSG